MQILTVSEALEMVKGDTQKPNRFSKKNFNILMTALANDVDFTAKVANVKKGELESVEDIMITKGFRKWCKKLVEKAGVDKSESERILTDAFVIDDMDGLYEFFATALYEYCKAGNRFSLLSTDDFKGSISIKNVPETTTVADAYSPKDRSYLGTYETTKGAHKELVVKTGCPDFLKNRKRVENENK